MIRHLLPLVALLAPAVSFGAAPEYVPVTGYLTDDTGSPVDGPATLHMQLYTVATGGLNVWFEDQDVDVDNGQFTVYMGEVTTLPLSLFRDNGTLYLGLTVDTGAEMSPRFQIATAPFAAYAQYADSAARAAHADDADSVGGILPGALRTTSSPVAWGDLGGVPADLADGDATGPSYTPGAGASYTPGAGVSFNGTAIAVDQTTIEGWAAAAVSGDFIPNVSCAGSDMVPVSDGIGGWTCENVNTLIDASQITVGTLNIAHLPTGASSTTVALGDHVHDASGITSGTLGVARIPTGTSGTTVALGDHTHTATSILGSIGASPGWPSASCLEIKTRNPAAADGVYWLNTEGDGRSAFSAYCDMTTDGGGWTMCYTSNGGSIVHVATEFDAAPVFGTDGYRADCRNLPFMDVMYVNHTSGEKAWFKRATRSSLTMSANYNAAGNVYGLWNAFGVANNTYQYQLNVCDAGWMWVGLMMSGRVGCDKACGLWCSDFTTQYYRTDGDNGGSYNGVSFKENGHQNVSNKTMSVGIR